MRNGLVENFYWNGTISERINYKDGKRNGLSEWFFGNGNIEFRINYKDNKRNGLFECFNEDGSLYKWQYFKEDIEISDKYIYLGSGEAVSKAEYRNKQIDSIIKD